MPRYAHPPEGPEDVTPADDVYRVGEDILIVHGPGQQTQVPVDKFYGDEDGSTDE